MRKWLKNKTMICVDCQDTIKMTAPNQKRCEKCAYDIKKVRAKEWMALHPEFNRDNSKQWYWQNREKKIASVMNYQKLQAQLKD